ncbi:MAG TPA: hypothetical protein VIY30_14335, partial [Burkholderiaceae bacterium]
GTGLRAGVGQAPREETAGHAAVVRLTLGVYGVYGESERCRRMRVSMAGFEPPAGQPLVMNPA